LKNVHAVISNTPGVGVEIESHIFAFLEAGSGDSIDSYPMYTLNQETVAALPINHRGKALYSGTATLVGSILTSTFYDSNYLVVTVELSARTLEVWNELGIPAKVYLDGNGYPVYKNKGLHTRFLETIESK
jgi:hypothetical protein